MQRWRNLVIQEIDNKKVKLFFLSLIVMSSYKSISQSNEDTSIQSFIKLGVGYSFFGGLDDMNTQLESNGFSRLKNYGIFDEIENGYLFKNNLISYGGFYRRVESKTRNDFDSKISIYKYGLFVKYGRDIFPVNKRTALSPSLSFSYAFSHISISNPDTSITSIDEALLGAENSFVMNSLKGDWSVFVGIEWSYLIKSKRDRLDNILGVYSRYCWQLTTTKWPITTSISKVNNLEFGISFTRILKI